MLRLLMDYIQDSNNMQEAIEYLEKRKTFSQPYRNSYRWILITKVDRGAGITKDVPILWKGRVITFPSKESASSYGKSEGIFIKATGTTPVVSLEEIPNSIQIEEIKGDEK